MKKFVCILLSLLCVVLVFSACGGGSKPEDVTTTVPSTIEPTTTKATTAEPVTTEAPTTAPPKPITFNLDPKTDEELVRSGGEFILRLLWDGLPAVNDDPSSFVSTLLVASHWTLNLKQINDAFSRFFTDKAIADLSEEKTRSTMDNVASDFPMEAIKQSLIVTQDWLYEEKGKLYTRYPDYFNMRHQFSELKTHKIDDTTWGISVPLFPGSDMNIEYPPTTHDFYILKLKGGKIDSIRWIGNRKLKEKFPTADELKALLPEGDPIYEKLRIALMWCTPLPTEASEEAYRKIDPIFGFKTVDDLTKKLDEYLAPEMYKEGIEYYLKNDVYKTIDGALYELVAHGSSGIHWHCVALWLIEDKDDIQKYRFDCISAGLDISPEASIVTFKNGKLLSREIIKK